MEPVIVWRGPIEVDEYGGEVQGDPEPVATWSALVEPKHAGEDVAVGRYARIVGYRIYIEDQGPSGILPTDLIEVRSPAPPDADLLERRRHLLPVDGIVGQWLWRDGRHKGDEFSVKVVSG